MSPPCDAWLDRLANLRKDASRGVAPHKPLLLLVVLDLFETGKISGGQFCRDGELAFRFNAYWALGAPGRRSRPEVMLPFFHTRSDGFWTPCETDGRVAEARELARIARLDPGFLDCLGNDTFRRAAREKIIGTHFHGETRSALADFVGIPTPEGAAPPGTGEGKGQDTSASSRRDARFAFQVLPAYNFTCALTGYRMVAEDGTTVLDAAHIQRFRSGGPNVVQNGLALSKTAHWLFDRGIWSVDERYHVLVKSRAFEEAGEEALRIKTRDGTRIVLPQREDSWPAQEFLAWHRQEHRF